MRIWTTEEEIGEPGGFGKVFISQEKVDGKIQEKVFAKKRLFKDDDDAKNRFKREVRLTKRLNHPRVVTVIGFNLTNEPYFYIMPLYKHSLQKIMREIKKDYQRIKIIFNSIFDGIEYLHSEGVYHRDLKPENILMNTDEELVISDLGLGIQKESDLTRLTETGIGMGTRFFIAPEQMENLKNVDHRADIYSLGSMLYLCLIDDIRDYMIRYEKLPGCFEYVVKKATENNKENRFPNIESFRKAFNYAMDMCIEHSYHDNFDELMNKVNSELEDDITIQEVIMYLDENIDNFDNINEIVMALTKKQFYKIENKSLEVTKRVINQFKQNISKQGWTFSYVDKIGRQCYNLLNISNDIYVKADLIYILIQIGSSHNRFYVMDFAREVLYDLKNETLAFVLAENLDEIKWEIEHLNLKKDKLMLPLRKLHAQRF